MTRLLAVALLALSSSALAAAPEKSDGKDVKAEPAPAAQPAASDAPAIAPAAVSDKLDREQLKREVMEEVRRELEKQKEELRSQASAQAQNKALEEEFQFHAERKRLELFELSGYLRVRPELFHKFDLERGDDADGHSLFRTGDCGEKQCTTSATANMRWRLEPTLNVSEDVKVRAQIDVLDNLVLGSTPSGGFGISERTQWSALSEGQAVASERNWLQDSIVVRRVYGEVNTPIGQLMFGRMGSQWGMGVLTSAGNDVDSDYGDTVDRIMFVAPVFDHYVTGMLDFVAEGPTSASRGDVAGQPYDLNQLDDARDYGISIAKRNTDLEITRKLQAGQYVLNYGAMFKYRSQTSDAAAYYAGTDPTAEEGKLVARNASLYIPDVWVKFQTSKLKLELELAGVFGKIGNATSAPGDDSQSVTLTQFGGAATGSYKVLDALDIGLELGFASGDKSPGMGNKPGRGTTKPGSIDGQQYCLTDDCTRDNDINNFRFNRDYRVDMILWREIFDGVTDAFYAKLGAKYEIIDGLGVWANVIYSRAIFGESTPSSHREKPNDPTSPLTGDENLGVEIDAGIRYDSRDGFMAGISYGVLFPLDGLSNQIVNPAKGASTAQAVRGWFVIKY